MKTIQLMKDEKGVWHKSAKETTLKNPLVLVHSCRYRLESESIHEELKALFPDGEIVFMSTSGNIHGNAVTDNTLCVTAIEFERTQYIIKSVNIIDSEKDSYQTGRKLMSLFPKENLKYVHIASDGSFVNGSELSKGLNDELDNKILITGGLCGDAGRFEKTLTSYNENPKEGEIIAIAFYGETLEVSCALKGGWTPFGPERMVTKSDRNILYEIDHQPALELYKKYLGDEADKLPTAALHFPLNVTSSEEEKPFVRTILNIEESDNSMILAGNIPAGSKVQFMMTNFDQISAAAEAAANEADAQKEDKTQLAILISCVGRKLVLDQRVEEEVEEVRRVIGNEATICGYYSYGEIAPFSGEINCQLHNQTMTVTLLSE